jgi:acyl transferase domain-containing protein
MSHASGQGPTLYVNDAASSGTYHKLLKDAVLQIRQLREQLDATQTASREPIAIIGMACRFPGGVNDPDGYWQVLRDGVNCITPVPAGRWDAEAFYDPRPDAPGKAYTNHGGWVSDIELFDPQVFGIAPREALDMDPQHRLVLEVSWEALERAGYAPSGLKGSLTGVIVGLGVNDYSKFSMDSGDPTRVDGYNKLGNERAFVPGRVAYALDLRGPVIQLDTTCSSALVGTHLACQALRLGEADLMLAGGVNLILDPYHTMGFCKLRALSPTGRSGAFDAGADGYVRGEGCGMIVLKRLSDALADGDRVLAVIRGSAVNHDGHSNGITAPNGPAQEAVVRRALEMAGARPADVQYVEAHGTGTSLGDPIEAAALARVLERNRADAPRLFIGSVKTNIGHLEAAAGVAGIMKIVLSLQHGALPPQPQLRDAQPLHPLGALVAFCADPAHPLARAGKRAGAAGWRQFLRHERHERAHSHRRSAGDSTRAPGSEPPGPYPVPLRPERGTPPQSCRAL